jgi:putative spermidine/putrescine transport system substrate-binding protein
MAEEALTVATWGGAYEAAQDRALFRPFTARTGLSVAVARYQGGLQPLRDRAGPEGWQVVDMLESDAIAACDAGLLHRLDHDALLAPADGVPLAEDFAPARLRPCSIPQNVFATVMAYDERAFPGVKPTRVADFFDLERFPGKRAVEKRPDAILEWALLAEGVPPAQVYDLLSTDRGLRLAFRKLDTIREAIVWWTDADEPARLLAEGDVAMASGYNGRFFAAAQEGGAPLVVVWDGRLIGYEVWAVPRTADPQGPAADFLRFAGRPGPMARLASRIPYGPARRSALERVGLHAETGIPMQDHLPNAPRHDSRALVRDSRWYARTRAIRTRRFEAWLSRGAGE